MKDELLTVEEVADILRTTPNTIYRWLRAGKLTGVKIGKEWRIKKTLLESRLTEEPPSKEAGLLEYFDHRNDHLMALAASEKDVYDLETDFIKRGLAQGRRLFKGCWWQRPDDVRKELLARGIEVDRLEHQNRLALIDLARAYDLHGVKGPIRAWRDEAEKTVELGYPAMLGSGSPDLNCCGNDFSNLLEFESSLDQALEELPVVGMCPYIIFHKTKILDEDMEKLINLMNCHKGVLFYAQGAATLMRIQHT